MNNRRSIWSLAAVVAALAGPLAVAVVGARYAAAPRTLAPQIGTVAAIALLVVALYVHAVLTDGWRWRDLGFAKVSWWSIPIGLALAAFFIAVLGPALSWALAALGGGGFGTGLGQVAAMPPWLLVATILVVAPAEELLYRAYAIERLGALIGSRPMAGLISLMAFALAHVPLWGWGPALTTVVSGGILTIVYLVRADVVALAIAHVTADLFGLVIGAQPTT
jgi:membrane protease YdiL (CAAX protease family)